MCSLALSLVAQTLGPKRTTTAWCARSTTCPKPRSSSACSGTQVDLQSLCPAVAVKYPDAEVRMHLVYLKYCILHLMPLMVYPKVIFHLNFSIKGHTSSALTTCSAGTARLVDGSSCCWGSALLKYVGLHVSTRTCCSKRLLCNGHFVCTRIQAKQWCCRGRVGVLREAAPGGCHCRTRCTADRRARQRLLQGLSFLNLESCASPVTYDPAMKPDLLALCLLCFLALCQVADARDCHLGCS